MLTATDEANRTLKGQFANLWLNLTILALVLLDLCWLVPWYRTLSPAPYQPSTLRLGLVLGGVMLVTHLLLVLTDGLRLLPKVQWAVMGAFLLACFWVGASWLLAVGWQEALRQLLRLNLVTLWLVLALLVAWWRALELGSAAMRPLSVWRRFQFALALFMLHLFYVAQWRGEMPGLGDFTFFFFIGFLCVILARLVWIGAPQGELRGRFYRRWLVSAAGILGLFLLVAALVGGYLSQQSGLFRWLAGILRAAIATIALLISFIPVLLMTLLVNPVSALLQWLWSLREATPYQVEQSQGGYVPSQGQALPEIPPLVTTLCFWALILGVAGLVLLFLRRGLPSMRVESHQAPESLLAPGDATRLLRQTLRETFTRWVSQWRPRPAVETTSRIRQVYAELLKRAASLNHPRAAAQTPSEFLPQLQELFPGAEDELEAITCAYLLVRYGEWQETAEQVATVEAAWRRLSETSRQKLD